MDGVDVKFISYAILLIIFFDNNPKYYLISLAPIATKEANETTDTTIEDAYCFNSYFITIIKYIYELDLITWGRVSIIDSTDANFKNRIAIKCVSYWMLQSKF